MIVNTLSEVKKFSENQINKFREILLSAGEVQEKTFEGLIAKNPKIIIIDNLENPKGIGALKIPYNNHRDKVFRLSKSKVDPNLFKYELGWIVSLEKGNGNKIMTLLVNNNYRIYATVRKDNMAMIYLLKKYKFKEEGISYLSDRGNYELLLFIR
jgi:hypothetical protein